MEEKNYEQVKAMVENWDEEWGCGPFEDCLPEEDELRRLKELTGRAWTGEEVRGACFEYTSHNSLEETVYYLFHGEYPPAANVDLAFWKQKPGAVLDPKTVYEKYRLGNQMKALIPLPMEEITKALRGLPGFQEHPWGRYRPEDSSVRMDCLEQPAYWSDAHFWIFWYGGRNNPRPDHLLCLSCHNLSGEQIRSLSDLMAGFDLSVRYQEESSAY